MDKEKFTLHIRPGTPADFSAALEIQRRAYVQKEVPLYGPEMPLLSETPETLAGEIAEGKVLLIGEYAGRIVASLRLKVRDDESVYFCRLSVDPDFQGRGIGQRMALAVEDYHPGAKKFVLDCGDKSAENWHIYTKLGYKKTGAEKQVPNGPLCFEMIKTRTEQGEPHV
ncbi:MAG: GNAT family N-acetyltransferase [Planctomycetes bacterium]|nr:GNAT family N-acetyltransferase [Planctomycetota bacterium]